MSTAYAVLFIDVNASPPAVKGAGIFSEPSPTVHQGNTRVSLLFKIDDAGYGIAADKAWSILASEPYDWTGEPEPKKMSRVVKAKRVLAPDERRAVLDLVHAGNPSPSQTASLRNLIRRDEVGGSVPSGEVRWPTVEELVKAGLHVRHPNFPRWHPDVQREFMEDVLKGLQECAPVEEGARTEWHGDSSSATGLPPTGRRIYRNPSTT